jgi:hypothetical protein
MKVEVELEDLETLIFATAIIKTFEGALQQRKQDPFIKPHLDYTKAHGALTLAMNSARRSENAGTLIAWDGELDDKEIKFLELFVKAPVFEIDGEYRKKHSEIDSLMAKGCIRMGQCVMGAVWPGEPKADIKPIPAFALAITKRGEEKLAKVLHEAKLVRDVK